MGDQNLSYNRFDYYSGSQITVWFGDIMIDDINSIQWSRSQNKKPIYGYASQQFDAVAKGTVIIQGSFVINFKQSGYLSIIMSQIARLYGEVTEPSQYAAVRKLIGTHLRNGTFGPKTADEIKDIANSPDFLVLAKAYEDTIWGGGAPGLPEQADAGTQTPTLLSSDVAQDEFIKNGFNIIVTYGNGSMNGKNRLSDYMRSTVKTLTGVHLVGDSQVIQVGGQPTLEQYDFIANGTDEQLSSLR